jgi:hypothetical protein
MFVILVRFEVRLNGWCNQDSFGRKFIPIAMR